MSKYTAVTVHEMCPGCTRLLRFKVRASWTDYMPAHFCCPHCGTPLEFTRDGKLIAYMEEVAPYGKTFR